MFQNIEKKVMILSVQLTLVYLWFLAAWPKLSDAGYMENFEKRFAESFLAALPGGMAPQVYFLGVLELAAGLLALVSLVKLEFLSNSYVWLQRCLALSALTFTALGFGLRVIRDHAGSGNIFFYLAGIVVFYLMTMKFSAEKQA